MSTTMTLERPSQTRAWILAARPKTLTAAAIPVVVGTGVALGEGAARLWPALAALVGSLLIQIGTNFTNDYYDFKKGADTHERLGPTRVTQSGMISPQAVLRAAMLCFGLAIVVGSYLVWIGGWPIVAIGLLSVLSGYAYTGGPFPLGYNGLGDLFVFIFFGLVAVAGTYYVQALSLVPAVWPPAVAVGALGTAILVTNNLRDISTDVKAGKRTLAVRFGATAARAEYILLIAVAFLCPVATVVFHQGTSWALLALAAAPFAVPPLQMVLRRNGAALNPALGATARLQLVFGVLYAIGLWRAHG
jgi:1,4-dihydroxy-2-naphthoate octaprenyltransferase